MSIDELFTDVITKAELVLRKQLQKEPSYEKEASWDAKLMSSVTDNILTQACVTEALWNKFHDSVLRKHCDSLLQNCKDPAALASSKKYLFMTGCLLVRKKMTSITNSKQMEKLKCKVNEWLAECLLHQKDIHMLLFFHSYMEFHVTVNQKSMNLWLHNTAIAIHHSPLPLSERLRITFLMYQNILLFYGPTYETNNTHADRLLIIMKYYYEHYASISLQGKTLQAWIQTVIETCIISDNENLEFYLQQMMTASQGGTSQSTVVTMTDTKKIWTDDTRLTLCKRHQIQEQNPTRSPTNYCLLLLHMFHLVLLIFVPEVSKRTEYFKAFQDILFPIVIRCLKHKHLESWWKNELGQHAEPICYKDTEFNKEIYHWFMNTCDLLHITSLSTLSQIRRCLWLFLTFASHLKLA